MRQRILATLLIASFGAISATASAQTTPVPNNTPRNAPVGTAAAPAVGAPAAPSTAGSTGTTMPAGTMAPMDNSVPTDMTGYKSARTACDSQAADMKAKCLNSVNTRFSSVAPKCQKLSGSGLDDCLKGADTGQ